MRCYQELHPDIPAADLGVSSDGSQQQKDSTTAVDSQLTNGHEHTQKDTRQRSRSVETATSRGTQADEADVLEEDQLTGSSSQGSLQQPAQRK